MRSSRAPRNLKSSAVSEHAKSKMHTRALRLEEEEQARAENRKIRVTVPPSSENSPITAAVSNMGRLGKEERSSILRLFDIAYLIPFKGRPYSDFTDIIELEKLHGVAFFSNSVYENDMGCKIFIHFAAKALFEKEVKDKIKRANFITVLADGAMDAALIEKEVVYVLFVDPDKFKPSLEFLSLKSVASQDAQGITSAIVDAFQDCDISEKLKRIVFFESDGTSVNSRLRRGVISLLQQRYGKHIKFFWCLSHRIELGLHEHILPLIQAKRLSRLDASLDPVIAVMLSALSDSAGWATQIRLTTLNGYEMTSSCNLKVTLAEMLHHMVDGRGLVL